MLERELLSFMSAKSQTIGWLGLTDVRDFCTELCLKFGLEKPSQDVADWHPVSHRAACILADSWGGGSDPSPFKIVASFSIAIALEAPLPEVISDEKVKELGMDPIVARFPRAFRGAVAFELSRQFLAGAKVGGASNLKPIGHPIIVSRHYFRDFVVELGLSADHGMTSLAYEALAYKTNPEAEDGDKI